MWHGVDGMGWWMLWGGLMMVLFWGGIIGLIVWGIQSVTGRPADRPADTGSAERNPLDIAKGRYARGEIGRDEFEQIREDLVGDSRNPSRSGVADAGTTAPNTRR